MCVSVPCVYLSLTVYHCLSLSHASLHTHNPTLTVRHSLSLVLVVMMKSKEVKTSRSILMLILWFSLIHCLLLPLPLADTVCHCFLLFSCCAVLCCLNSKERILIALEDTRNLKIYVKVFGTSQKWKAFTTPKQHRICIKELDLPLLDLPLVESFTFTYNSPSLPAPLSQLWDDFIKDYVTFRETTQNLHQEAWFTTTLKWGSSNTTLSMSFQ